MSKIILPFTRPPPPPPPPKRVIDGSIHPIKAAKKFITKIKEKWRGNV